MKVLLDTNVLVAAFVSHGSCHELLEHCFHHHEIVLSHGMLEEFRDVLSRKFRFTRAEVRESVHVLRLMVDLLDPQPLEKPVCRDPDDDRVLATAVTGEAACIVTGDKDLLTLEEYEGVVILAPDRFWRFEEG